MTNHQEQLERLIGTLLEGQPPQRAPSSLQARVFAKVQARDAATGEPCGFTHWPRFAQVVFALAAAMAAKLALRAADWGMATLGSASFYKGAVGEVSWIWTLMEAVISSLHRIPALWWWSAATVVTAVSLGCLAISAVAYRVLYAR